jgi:hypothetical protein
MCTCKSINPGITVLDFKSILESSGLILSTYPFKIDLIFVPETTIVYLDKKSMIVEVMKSI